MAFGQQAGPPAHPRQVEALLEAVRAAGFEGFREARHPLGLTQRQAAGRFTRAEADALIEQLRGDGAPPPAPPAGASSGAASPAGPDAHRRAAARQLLARLPSEDLAAELERRGWFLVGP